jgi:hypothetical protein
MLVAELAPVMCPPAHNAPDNELDELPFPTPTGVLGPWDEWRSSSLNLSDMPDFMEGVNESLHRALDALPIPTQGPPPAIYEGIRCAL